MFPVAFAIIREKFSNEKLAIGQGIFTAVFSAGAVIGLGLGATIVEYFSWHMTFLSIVPLMVILLVVVLKWVRIDSEKLVSRIRGSIDISGTLVLICLVSTFLVGLTILPNTISNPNNNQLILILALLMISIALLPIFIFTQRRAQYPIMDLDSDERLCSFTSQYINNDHRCCIFHNISNLANLDTESYSPRIWWWSGRHCRCSTSIHDFVICNFSFIRIFNI